MGDITPSFQKVYEEFDPLLDPDFKDLNAKQSFNWKFLGNFKNDFWHGFGKCWYPNGDIYTGEFK